MSSVMGGEVVMTSLTLKHNGYGQLAYRTNNINNRRICKPEIEFISIDIFRITCQSSTLKKNTSNTTTFKPIKTDIIQQCLPSSPRASPPPSLARRFLPPPRHFPRPRKSAPLVALGAGRASHPEPGSTLFTVWAWACCWTAILW